MSAREIALRSIRTRKYTRAQRERAEKHRIEAYLYHQDHGTDALRRYLTQGRQQGKSVMAQLMDAATPALRQAAQAERDTPLPLPKVIKGSSRSPREG